MPGRLGTEAAVDVGPDDVVWMGAARQADLLRQGAVSSCELVTAVLERIERLDPMLNAFRVVLADAAMGAAAAADAARHRGDVAPLLGVPVAIKDDTDVAGQVTAWGTRFDGAACGVDAPVVARLRAAGAVIVGKTQLPELALWPWTSSAASGTTRNPWDLDRSPGGSSGGSAVAVATAMSGVALGSDGGGSIRNPAAHAGLFGLKPQRGRIALGPEHLDAWHGLVAAGPLARHVRDAAVFLDATADGTPSGGWAASLGDPVGPLRIAVAFKAPPGSAARLTAPRRVAVERTAQLLHDLGHQVFEHDIDFGLATMWNSTVRYLSGAHDDAGRFDRPLLEPRTRRLAALANVIPRRTLRRARRAEAAIAARINTIYDSADVVLTPMTGDGPPRLADVPDKGVLRSLRHANVSAWAVPWNVIGQPAASIPAGLDADGLPVAVQLCGRPNDEVTILCLAHQLEVAARWTVNRPPIS